MLKGIDVSHHNGVINWKRVKAAGYTFVFIKAGEGLQTIDPRFFANWKGAHAEGFYVSGYDFFHPADDPVKEAQHFISLLKSAGFGPKDLPPVLDAETAAEILGRDAVSAHVEHWVAAVEAGLKVKPYLYTASGTWPGNATGSEHALKLWVADYGHRKTPRMPVGFQDYELWQFSEHGHVDGIPGSVDLNSWNTDEAGLKQLIASAQIK